MKRWMVYTLIAASAVAIILIIALPGLLDKEPVLEIPVQVVNQGEKLKVDLKPFVKDERVDEVTLVKSEGPGELVNYTYTFDPGFKYDGEVVVKVTATDKRGKSFTGDLKVNVIRVNRPPEIDTTPLKISEGQHFSLDLTSIVKDPDNDKIDFSIEGPGEVENGIYTYSPGYTAAGEKVLRISAVDSQGNETVRDITLKVMDKNAPPTLEVSNQKVAEGESLKIDLASSASDLDGDEIEFSLVSGPGKLEETTFTYNPDYDEAGEKEIVIKLQDSQGNEAFSTVKINVIDVNRAPGMLFSDQVIKEGEKLVLTLSNYVVDPDGDPLELTLEGPGRIENGEYIYEPDFEAAGEKSVTIKADDGKDGKSQVTFNVQVQNVNREPIVALEDVTLKEGEELKIQLADHISDPDGDELKFELTEGPGNLEGDIYTYTPDYEDAGVKQIKLKISGDVGGATETTFKVTVENMNRAPNRIVPSLVREIEETKTLELELNTLFQDLDGDELTYTVEGTGNIENSIYNYTPGYSDQGEQTATITAYDPEGLSIQLPVTLRVKDTNRLPSMSLSDASILENETYRLNLREKASDPDGDELEFKLDGPGTLENGVYSYTPTYDEAGEYTIRIEASDGKGGTATAAFKLLVVDFNRAPTLELDEQSVKEGQTLKIDLRSKSDDPDGDALTFEVVEGPGSVENHTYTFKPSYQESGEYEVSMSASDGKDGKVVASFALNVLDVNRPPSLTIPDQTTEEGQKFELYLKAFALDPDEDELTFELLEGPGSIEEGFYVFQPTYDESGKKKVTVKVRDAKGAEASETFSLEVLDVNRNPSTSIEEIRSSVKEDSELEISLNTYFEDQDGDQLELSLEGPGKLVDGIYSYTPGFDEAGEKTATITARDGKGGSVSLPLIVNVIDVNRPPTGDIPDREVKEGETLEFDLRDFTLDPDGDKLKFELISGPGIIENGTYKFLPAFDLSGLHTVEIALRDDRGEETRASFDINVLDVNRQPILILSDESVDEGKTLTLSLESFARDLDEDALSFQLLEGPGKIDGSTYTYSPTYTEAGSKTVLIRVEDAKGGRSEASFTVEVTDVNVPPEVTTPEGETTLKESVKENETLKLELDSLFSDPDGDELVYTLEGTGSISNNSYEFRPGLEDQGSYEVKVVATDPGNLKRELTILIDVIDVNRPPTIELKGISIEEGSEAVIDFNTLASDPDGDSIDFEIVGPGTLEGSTYTFKPGYNEAGEYSLAIKLTDTRGGETSVIVPVKVVDVNRPPRLTLSDESIEENSSLTIDLKNQSVDPDGDEVTFKLIEGPGTLENGVYTFETTYEDSGVYTVVFGVSDGQTETTGRFNIEVVDLNRAPVLNYSTTPVRTLKEGEQFSLNLKDAVSDPDGDRLRYEILSGPGELIEDTYTYSPTMTEAGEKEVTLKIDDEKGGQTIMTFKLSVQDVTQVVSLIYALPSLELDTVKIVAGTHETTASGNFSLIEPGWAFDFQSVAFFKVGEEGEEPLGSLNFTAEATSVGAPILSPDGTQIGYAYIGLE